jgi:predicted dienelactone hydrolase
MNRSRIAAAALAVALVAVAGSASRAHAEQTTKPCKPDDPETCDYESDLSYTADSVDLVIRDPARGDYPIPLTVRYPSEATDLRSVVIWHHGGTTARRSDARSVEWGETLARAGYVVIHPARVEARDVTPYLAECAANGVTDPAHCAEWYGYHRNGALITSAVIDQLSEIENLAPALQGRLDASKIVVAGHSGGTSAVLANAGGRQQFVPGGPVYREEDSRPIAFLATAPQGPAYAGFTSGFDEKLGFVDIERPLLMITGMGDETGEPVPTRLTAWITSKPGQKTLVWDTDPEAVHETMDIDKCNTPVRADHCRWLASAGVAWLDAVVRDRREAWDWLAEDALATLTGGAIELHER